MESPKDSDVSFITNFVGSLCASLHNKYLSFPYVLHKVSLSSNIYSKIQLLPQIHTYLYTHYTSMKIFKSLPCTLMSGERKDSCKAEIKKILYSGPGKGNDILPFSEMLDTR